MTYYIERNIIMKKYLFLAAALILSLTVAGCSGNKGSESGENPIETAVTDKADKTDKTDKTDTSEGSGGEQADGAGETEEPAPRPNYDEKFTDADKDVDMDAIGGSDTTVADDSEAEGEVNGAKVKIRDAVVADYNDQKAIVVSFEFKNNTASDVTFTSLLTTEAEQGDVSLVTAPMFQAEGFVPETLVQIVPSGDKITVQRAYILFDETTPVTIFVENAVNNNDTYLKKTFNIQ